MSADILSISVELQSANPPVSLCTSLDTLQTNTYHCQIFTSNFLFENKYSTVQTMLATKGGLDAYGLIPC